MDRTDQPIMYPVTKVMSEGKGLKTIFLKGEIQCDPGQFIMVWLPGVEEKPMAVSYLKKNEFAFTYHTIGKFTKACDELKKGDLVGVRGPYGKGFSLKKNAIVVGGGVGMSSVALLVEKLNRPLVINGARDGKHVLYEKRFKNMVIMTDDGSKGKKGFTTDALRNVLEAKKGDIVYTCGPEIMMNKVVKLCEEFNVECEASVERYMKCGFGVCGNCLVNGMITCMDGPVLNKKLLLSLSEFGESARLKTGKKVCLKEYYGWRG